MIFRPQGAVVLVDEYDKPILDNINDMQKADEMRRVLRSFYTTLKSCDEYLRFVMLTGISKFSKASEWIEDAADRMKLTSGELLERLKEYYDGFSFDGVTRLYNPFSIMQCLAKAKLNNYMKAKTRTSTGI